MDRGQGAIVMVLQALRRRGIAECIYFDLNRRISKSSEQNHCDSAEGFAVCGKK